MKRLFLLVAALAAMAFAVPASATTLLYSIVGTNGFSANFALDDTPAAFTDLPGQPGVFFVFDVPGRYSDGASIGGLTFYDSDNLGGLTITTTLPTILNDISFTGATLFSGTLTNPTLLPFAATTFLDYTDPSISYTVSAIPAVPEPATWAMLLLGFGMVGVAVRRRAAIAPARFA